MRQNFICQMSVFWRRGLLAAIGEADITLHHAMDYDLWIRLTAGAGAAYLPEVLARFRLHEGSKTVSKAHALDNARECLAAVERHFGWAPANRVYALCWYRLHAMLPPPLRRFRTPVAAMALLISLGEYLKRNRGIRSRDIRLAARGGCLRKLRGGWEPRKHLAGR